MSIAIWSLVMVLLGLAGMGLCYLFMEGCEKI